MAGKEATSTSDLKEQPDSSQADDKMECEDIVSGTGSVEMAGEKTDSEKATGSFEKTSEAMSPMTPDTTSGLEMKFESPADTPSGAESFPTDTPTDETPGQKGGKTSAFGVFRKILSPQKKEQVHEADSTSPKDKAKTGSISFLRTRFRASKSMSPPQKALDDAIEEEPAEVSADDQAGTSPQKKIHKGIGSKIKKSLSSMAGFFSGNKGSATSPIPEAVGLLVDTEASELAAGTAALNVQELTVPAPVPEESVEEEITPTPEFEPYWQEGAHVSVHSQLDANLTQLTDAPSICSGSDIFDETLSRASSDKTSEEASAAILDQEPSDQEMAGKPISVETEATTEGQKVTENPESSGAATAGVEITEIRITMSSSKAIVSGVDLTEIKIAAEASGETTITEKGVSELSTVTESSEASITGREAPENTAAAGTSADESTQSPIAQGISDSSKAERTPVKRPAETPSEVLIQEEGTASPFKKPNVDGEQRPSEKKNDDENKMAQDP